MNSLKVPAGSRSPTLMVMFFSGNDGADAPVAWQ